MGPYCEFCAQRCFVLMPTDTPSHIAKAYQEEVGLGIHPLLATCKKGQSHEKNWVGYCYNDILTMTTGG